MNYGIVTFVEETLKKVVVLFFSAATAFGQYLVCGIVLVNCLRLNGNAVKVVLLAKAYVQWHDAYVIFFNKFR